MAVTPNPEQPTEEKVLFEWKAPARPFKRRSREFYVTLVSIVVLLGVILFAVEGLMPVILLATLLFLFYVLSTVPPSDVDYKITSYGVRFADHLNGWDNLGRFWLVNRLGADLLVFETFSLPGRLELVAPKEIHEKAKQVLRKYLVEEEIPPSAFDKAANWASRRLPQK